MMDLSNAYTASRFSATPILWAANVQSRWTIGYFRMESGVDGMETVRRLAALLPEAEEILLRRAEEIREVRLKIGQPIRLVGEGFQEYAGAPLLRDRLREILSALMEFSLHTREAELNQGFFTLEDGCRVGVSGRLVGEGADMRLTDIASACVRIAREVRGCADALVPLTLAGDHLNSMLICSSPGFGKTTCLRDLARQLSVLGFRVCVADERHELAACRQGVPTLDLGPCSDVMDGGPKARVMGLLLRSMGPEVIVTDEIGGLEDAAAVVEARRCGVAVLASAHGDGLEDLRRRPGFEKLLESGVFDIAVHLGGRVGQIRKVTRLDGIAKGGELRFA